MITVYTNIKSSSVLNRFQKLMAPIQYQFLPLSGYSSESTATFLIDGTDPVTFPSTKNDSTFIYIHHKSAKNHPATSAKIVYLQAPFRLPALKILLQKLSDTLFTHSPVQLNFKKRTLSHLTNHQNISLTEKETQVLLCLFQSQATGHLSKKDLLREVWGYKSDMETHTLETHLYRLRRKIKDKLGISLIHTENNYVGLKEE
ncbi:MAG: hypothetical protein CMM87_02700 [Rickettsiales bacterium]|nr:hypothetical protein [Rickettsiales bacterium]|tara:strand:- start:5703 stop:6308 length:606 start_codon:yes stop_codon:yes gene_type:complete